MAKDKYTAVWVSHSSISDWLVCPRAYFLKNVYKDPKTGRKISLVSPPLTLGKVVHEVVEGLSVLPLEKRFNEPLLAKFEEKWQQVSGRAGGFFSKDVEMKYKQRGQEMLKRITRNPGPLNRLAVKIQMELPYYWLSEKDNIILCGMIDWLEYLEKEDAVAIIDFKTGKKREKKGSLQLPIYYLLATETQKRAVKKASYWYVSLADKPVEQKLPDAAKSREKILKIAKEIKLARQLERFKCPNNGCRACEPFEDVINGKAELVGTDNINRDVYIYLKNEDQTEGEIL